MKTVRDFRMRLKMICSMLKLDGYTFKYIESNKRRHTFHIVDNSPWPIVFSFCLFLTAIGFILWVHEIQCGNSMLFSGLICDLIVMLFWFQDVVTESTFLGHHTKRVQQMLKIGFLLFLVTEVMFFAGFFWAFFHGSLSPSGWIGAEWPAVGIKTPDHLGIPLLNTGILICSGLSFEIAVRALKKGNRKLVEEALIMTLFLGFIFMGLQIYEYFNLLFSVSDGIYGASFFMLTGLHFFHVLVGVCFILASFIRYHNGHLNKKHFLGLKISGFYWHFVDVVWVFLYCTVYWWAKKLNFYTPDITEIFWQTLNLCHTVLQYLAV